MLKPGKCHFHPVSLSHTAFLGYLLCHSGQGENSLPWAPLQQQMLLALVCRHSPPMLQPVSHCCTGSTPVFSSCIPWFLWSCSEQLPAGTRPRLLVIFSNQCYRRSRKPLEGCSSNSLHLELNYPFLYKSWHIKIKYDILWCLRWADNAPLPKIVKGGISGWMNLGLQDWIEDIFL